MSVFSAAVAAVCIFSCKKNNDTPACAADMSHIAGTYKLTALQYQPSSSAAAQDYYAYLDDCQKDDLLVLNANGSYDYKDMGTVCTPSGSEQGSWQIKNNQLIATGTELNTGTISSYDCKTLVYYASDVVKSGDKMTFTMTRQ
jgi:hypothetical protein